MPTIANYQKEQVEACYSVLLELATILGSYRESIILIGGWVPFLLTKNSPELTFPHSGSLDVDLLFNPAKIDPDTYRTIQKLLEERGYYQKPNDQPFVFHRDVTMNDGRPMTVEIDLLAGEYGGTGKTRRHQRIQTLLVRKARGSDLTYTNFVVVKLDGTLPNGAKTSVELMVANIVSILVMKGMALGDRFKEKDAYDIYYLCRNYPDGPDAVIEALRPHRNQKLTREALEEIKERFGDINGLGPVGIVEFMGITDVAEKIRRQRDAYEVINYILEKLGV